MDSGRRIVTFTTDFGTADGYVGAMKGVVARLAPDAALVDVAHDVAAQDVVGGALGLAAAAPFFPAGTVHVAVVDPGVGGARAEVVVSGAGGQVFVGPDNGLLSLAAATPRRTFRIAAARFRAATVSPTFHGRDVFAVAAGRIAAGAAVEDAGPELAALAELPLPPPGDAAGEVIHVDRFGNLVTNIVIDLGPPPASSAARVATPAGTVEAPLCRTYGDVAPGALVAYVGSANLVEIAVRDGSAAERLGAGRGAAVRLVPKAPAP